MVGWRDDLEVVEICYYYQKRDVGKSFIRAFARWAIFFENLAMLPCPTFVLLGIREQNECRRCGSGLVLLPFVA